MGTRHRAFGLQSWLEEGRPPVQGTRVLWWALVVVANLLPALAVLSDSMTLDEAIAVFFLELCLAGPVTILKLCTSKDGPEGGPPLAVRLILFVVLYGGICVTTSVYAIMLVGLTPMAWALAGFLLASEAFGLVCHWFVGGERHVVTREQVFWRPMVRFFAVLMVLGWFSGLDSEFLVFVVILILKSVFDLAMDYLTPRLSREPSVAEQQPA